MTKKLKVYRPCLHLCGELTQSLYHSGCDQKVRVALARDMADGNPDTARVLQMLADKSVSDDEKRRVYAEYHAT